MYIKTFLDGAAVITSEEQDRPCSNLIAAAPDLLAALERLTSTLDAISLSDEEAWTSDLIAARAAIAKAYEGVE